MQEKLLVTLLKHWPSVLLLEQTMFRKDVLRLWKQEDTLWQVIYMLN